ncbi:hypothetical protein OPV22_002547 [Ensete ventricosum]|uniref:Uncharacterized protein n=1 Tax=Ensete ventricosum TaxID=4639 RepID=A0AAV8RY85_ENSVE|nr:hypothetical protein OPV22_002547 [Ensete ventricosum]
MQLALAASELNERTLPSNVPVPSQSSSTHQPAMLHRDNSMGPHDNNRSVLWRARGTVVCTISIRIAGKVLPFASFAVRRFARPAKNGPVYLDVFWAILDPTVSGAKGSNLGTLEPPGWHRAGWGIRVAGKVPPVASFALRRSPLARGGPKRPVLACFWAVFASCGGRGEGSSGRGIRVAGKVCCPPLRSPSVARRSLWRPKTASFGLFLGRFWRAAATAASGAKRQPSQHPGTPRVAQGWMGLSYSREGAARRFVRSPPLAARSGGPKRPVLACFWAVFACCGGRGERSSGRGIRVVGKVLPFASFAVRRSPLARAAKNGQFLACFWAVFCVPRRPRRAVRNVSHLSTLEPPGWHRAGWGFRIAGKVPPVASFALRSLGRPKTASFGLFLGRFRVLRWAR